MFSQKSNKHIKFSYLLLFNDCYSLEMENEIKKSLPNTNYIRYCKFMLYLIKILMFLKVETYIRLLSGSTNSKDPLALQGLHVAHFLSFIHDFIQL